MSGNHTRYGRGYLSTVEQLYRQEARRRASGELITTASSFAQAVHIFRNRTNRIAPIDAPARFKRVFIALYETTPGPEFGRTRCFDVIASPPKNGIPRSPLTMPEMLSQIVDTYGQRNNTKVVWTDEPAAPEDLEELIEISSQDEDDEEE